MHQLILVLRSVSLTTTRASDAWYDSVKSGHATLALLALFTASWTAFHVIAYASLDLHPDLVEVFAWSRHPALGYNKHPPLASLMAGAWFSVFPVADWSFTLLAMVNSAIGLFGTDLIARRYLSGDKRVFALLLLLLTPFYQFMGQRFASNQTLLSTWPIATYCFLRAFHTRGFVWSVAAGIAAALAMLGKYYSIYLIGSFGIAVLCHPARWTYLKSASPWLSAAFGLALLAPHGYWLITTGYQPLKYAYVVHGDPSFWRVIAGAGSYLAGAIAYVAVPIAVFLIAVQPTWSTLRTTLWPADPDRRMLVVLFAGFLLLPALTAPFMQIVLTSVWTMQIWFLLPIVLLAPDAAALARPPARRVAQIVFTIFAGALLISPGLAWYYHAHGTRQGRAYYRLASDYMTDTWHQLVGSRLRIVMGSPDFGEAATFYSPDSPDAVPAFDPHQAPWVGEEDLDRYGFAVICGHDEPWCEAGVAAQLLKYPSAHRVEKDFSPVYLGQNGIPHRVLFLFVPPTRLR